MKVDVEIPTCREGVFVPVGFADPQQVVATAEAAESLGYDAVWATDFVTPTPTYQIPDPTPPRWFEPLITLAYCAARTKTIKLGTGVLLAPFREPVILAKQVATLDALSGGRMLLGLGIGLCRQELAAVRPKEANAPRGEVLDELIASLRLLLAHQGKSVSFSGKHLQFGEIALDPKPVQNPMPIYVPGKVVEALERIARFGLGMMVQGTVAQARVEALKPILEKHGRGLDEIDVVIEGQIRLASTREKAIADYHASRQGQFSLKRGAQPDKLIADNWIGTPAEVIDKIMAVARKGFSHFCVLHISGDSFQERIEQMEIFAKEVMPNLK